MPGLTSLLHTARDALAAQSFGLAITGQNVSNVNTEGYVRRDPLLESKPLGSYGTVEIAGLRRATDQFTERRYFEVTGLASSAQERHLHLSGMETLFNESAGTGIGSSLDAMLSSFSELATNPDDPTARATTLERAAQFAERMGEAADRLTKIREELLGKGQGVVSDVNLKAKELAGLNRRIQMLEAAGNDAADLKDQRTQLLLGLASEVDVHTFTNTKGEMVIQASGTTLVEGGTARQLSLGLDAGGDMQLFASSVGGGPPTEITQFLSGGTLAGIRDARDVEAVAVLNSVDQLAYDVATAVNAQHSAGYGLDGVTGRDLFTVSATPAGAARSLALDAQMVGQPDRLAASDSATGLAGNSGNALALADLANQQLASGGTRTFAEGYADVVGDVGNRAATAGQEAAMRDAMSAQVFAMRESHSGVSLDEEMVSLTRYQRAYEAAARVLSTVDQLLQELMSTVR